ncbi:MAG: polysaccharide deacetylase family protein [Candidatus Eremiobacteraeota bacterium]|nr:polysaccharide deacetylase family protein [Candidatus Eremiobacteraeota bacterium]
MRRREAVATLVAALAAPRAAFASAGVPVLMYHAVNDTHPHNEIALGLTLPSKDFEEQLRYLQAHGIVTLTVTEIVDGLTRRELPKRAVGLTFDDGYADAGRIAFPLLQRYGAKATFFVNSGSIGTPNHLTWKEIRAMHAGGMEIGGHGQHHLDLTTLDRAEQMREAGGCLDRIARWAGFRPLSYAYASGQYNATTLDVMRTIGVRSAWTERYGTAHDLHEPYEMPRLRVARGYDIAQFAALVSSGA